MEIKYIRPKDLARRLRAEGNESFLSWVRLVIALSGSSLSILLAFRNNYVPADPQYLLLLSCGYFAFIITILSGLLILHSESQTKIDSAASIEKVLEDHSEEVAAGRISKRGGRSMVRPVYRLAHYFFHVSMGLSFTFITLFIVINP